jgi:hypothetical protein
MQNEKSRSTILVPTLRVLRVGTAFDPLAFCSLQFAFVSRRADSPPARTDGDAQRKRANSSPNRLSRTASLLHRPSRTSRGKPVSSHNIKRVKSLREKCPSKGGEIIRRAGQQIKVAWRRCHATQGLVLQRVMLLQLSSCKMDGRKEHLPFCHLLFFRLDQNAFASIVRPSLRLPRKWCT